MKNQKVVLRFDENCTRDKYGLRRIEGTATADSLVRLIDIADLDANPREAKAGDVTDDIQESLEKTPQLFPFKSKGLLLACGACVARERNRYELSFEDGDIEGVLDGGHNLLAIALFILRTALGDDGDSVLRKVKRWEHLPPIWQQYKDKVEDAKSALTFLTPVEIIYPQDGLLGRDEFQNAVLDVARARNNNAQLTEETKANKAGFYEAIKESIDPALVQEIEWKTNDGGRIKVRDLVALAWIALSKLDDDLPGLREISDVSIYNSKGACITAFNKLMESDRVTQQVKGDIRSLTHPGVRSALALLRDLPRLFDQIYDEFPEAYNAVSPGFGRIGSVYVFDPAKAKVRDPKYLAKPPKTKFYKRECKYDFPDGFIMPLAWALRELIKNEAGLLSWDVASPDKFLERHLKDIMRVYLSVIQLATYDPQRIGKSGPSYQLACNELQSRLASDKALTRLGK